jgi:hypothetical protein
MGKYLEREAEAAAVRRNKLKAEASKRWQQLTRAVWRRRTLRDTYDYNAAAVVDPLDPSQRTHAAAAAAAAAPAQAHVHSYPIELQDHDDATGITRKKCVLCGLVVEVEEM